MEYIYCFTVFGHRLRFVCTFAINEIKTAIFYFQHMDMNNRSWYSFERKRMWLALLPSILFVTLVWLAFIVDSAGLSGWNTRRLGILPGEVSGLKGIIFSPFLHSSFSHLWSNTIPLLILIGFLFYFYSKIAFTAFLCLWFSSGFVTWIIGRDSYHVGASGLVFAILFFLFFSGIFRRYTPLVAVSLIVAFIYGGYLPYCRNGGCIHLVGRSSVRSCQRFYPCRHLSQARPTKACHDMGGGRKDGRRN